MKMICEKCGKELPGNYCGDCGIVYDFEELDYSKFISPSDFVLSRSVGDLKIDLSHRLWKVKKFGGKPSKTYRFGQIKRYSVVDESTQKIKTSTSSAIGRSLIGGGLFGSAGAVIGGATAKKSISTTFYATVRIWVKNEAKPVEVSAITKKDLDNIINAIEDMLSE